jgi:hypothetical protein
MIPIWISNKLVREPLGWRVDTCPHCRHLRPFLVEELVEKQVLWSVIPVGTSIKGREQSCYICDLSHPFRAHLALDTAWTPDRPIHELEQFHQLGEVAGKDHRVLDKEDLILVLQGIQRRTRGRVRSSGGAGLLFGILMGVLAALSLGERFAHEPLIFWAVCVVGGAILGVTVEMRHVARVTALNLLGSAMERHALTVEVLTEAERIPGKDFGTVSRVIRAKLSV